MCGIVSIFAPDDGQPLRWDVLRAMTGLLAHRGPDDAGYAGVDLATGTVSAVRHEPGEGAPRAGLLMGHRRLSILDLSPAGHQPMASADGSLLLAYNGEIYNYLELREALQREGCVFRSGTDTEVLLQAWQRWGARALERCNGMWGFVLWDARTQSLFAARDRFGVKPLYYTVVDGVYVFASEIKALLAYPGANRGHDEDVVNVYLRKGRLDEGERTMFRGVAAVPAGGVMEVTRERCSIRRFWTLDVARAGRRVPDGELIGEFGALLRDAVRLRVRSDVPIGTMMSGGLDSTTITALIRAQQERAEAGAHAGLRAFHHTFSACWPGSSQDEEKEIDLVCAALQLRSHKLYPSAQQLADVLPEMSYHLDAPFHDPIAAVQYLLMRQARSHGVKVVLNGHGSDEALAGYHELFVPGLLAGHLRSGRLPALLREWQAFAGTGWAWQRVLGELARAVLPAGLVHARADATKARMRAPGGFFAVELAPDLLEPAAAPPGLTPLGGALWHAVFREILPRWLRMEDRMSMAWGVESRLPFLDYRLVELAFRLPDDLKLRDGYNKFVLRRAMQGVLPERLVQERAKRRFIAPFWAWGAREWRPLLEEMLMQDARISPYLDYARFRARLREYLAGNTATIHFRVLWRLLGTEMWMRSFSAHSARGASTQFPSRISSAAA
jgi:asparagine synthase (glutamine-hydrolysing)